MYAKQGRYPEAEKLALTAYAGTARALGPQHARTKRLVGDLVSLYEAWGKPAEAASWRAILGDPSVAPK
jgi:hypothetical protein